MKRSAAASFFAHGALLFGALFVLPEPEEFKVKLEEAIQVDISNIQAETKIKATTVEAKPPVEQPKAEKTEVKEPVKPAPKVAEEVVEAAKPKEPEPAPPEPPKPEDKPVEDKKLEEMLLAEAEAEAKAAEVAELALKKKADEEKKKEEAEAKKKAEAEKKKKLEEEKKQKAAEAKKKAAEEAKKKPKLDVAELEALLNKENDERTAPKESADTDGNPDQGEREQQGDDAEISASLSAALRKRYSECWAPPPAVREQGVGVIVEFQLNEDGTLRGQPDVIGGDNGPLFQVAATAAISAVTACAPYDWMPPDRYDIWKTIKWKFKPDSVGG